MIQDFAKVLQQELQEDVDSYMNQLATSVRSWDEYKNLTGLIRGLRLAQDRISSLAERAAKYE